MTDSEMPVGGTTNDGGVIAPVSGGITPAHQEDECQQVVDINLATAGLEAIEAVVERGIDTFITVGEALLAIRDRYLYGQGTFEEYLQERWGMSRQRGYQFMNAAIVVRTMTANGLIAPKSESAARALATIKNDPEALAGVSKILEGTPATGESVRAAVKRVTQKAPPVEQAPGEKATGESVKAVVKRLTQKEQIQANQEKRLNHHIECMFGTAARLCSELGVHFPQSNKGEFVEKHLLEAYGFERETVEKAIGFFITLRNIGDKLNWFEPLDTAFTAPVAS